MAPGDNAAFLAQRGEGQGAGAQLRDALTGEDVRWLPYSTLER